MNECSRTPFAPVAGGDHATMYVVFELSKTSWQLGIVRPGSEKLSRHEVAGGDVAAVRARLGAARSAAEVACGGPVRVVSAYEAGYDGFWLHRWLALNGVENRVLDPSSIMVNRRRRRAKTDRLDVEQLMRVLLAHERGEPKVCSVARAPSVAEEDARRRHRERERLVRERVAHGNRIKGLLFGQGIREVDPLRRDLVERLARRRTGDGGALQPALLAELRREHARLRLVLEQIADLEAEIRALARAAAPGSSAAKVAQLTLLKGIGATSAQVLVHEVFYRRFANRREVGSYLGLVGVPYNSGQQARDQGISKAGNGRARTLAVELAWLWLRHQPDSALSRWFVQRVGILKGRPRRIAIVALARKLAIALWRFLDTGLVPEGASLRAAA